MSTNPVEIVIGDSQFLVRRGLEELIRSTEDFDLKQQVETGEELVSAVASYLPDVVILDHQSDDFSLDLINQIRNVSPDSRLLIISSDLIRGNIFRAIELGANSFVTKHCSEQEILNAIIATSKNERFFCNRILEVFIDRPEDKPNTCEPTNLTDREVEILQLIGEGNSTKELADLLHLSQHTIYTHRKNMMRKLGVNSSTDLILTAVNLGLIKATNEAV